MTPSALDIGAVLVLILPGFLSHRTAEATGLDIIDPRDSRPLLCEFMDMAQSILKTQLGQGAGPTYRP